MSTTRVQTLPASWDDARDLPFFRMTDRLFPPDVCLGASVLLASYDDDTSDTVHTPTATERGGGTPTPAIPDRQRHRGPAQIRRTR